MTHTISNSDTVIDSRDVITRIEELDSELRDAYDSEQEQQATAFVDWCEAAAEEAKQDYMSVDFDGVEYWIRA